MDSSSNRAVASAKAGRLISAKGELTTDYVDRMDSQGATAGHAQSASNCRASAAADASQEPSASSAQSVVCAKIPKLPT